MSSLSNLKPNNYKKSYRRIRKRKTNRNKNDDDDDDDDYNDDDDDAATTTTPMKKMTMTCVTCVRRKLRERDYFFHSRQR